MKKQTLARAKTRVAAAMFAAAMGMGSVAGPIAMTIPVYAEGSTTVTRTISARNIESNATVTAYQLVTGNYSNDGKFTGYSFTKAAQKAMNTLNNSKEDVTFETVMTNGFDADGLSKLAIAVAGMDDKGTAIAMNKSTDSDGKATFSADVAPGMYLVLVTKTSNGTIYNPALLSVNISDANDLTGKDDKGNDKTTGSEIDMTGGFTYGSDTAYIKSSLPEIDKKIMNVSNYAAGTTTTAESAKGDAIAIGDVAEFQIDRIKIPSYSKQYANPTFNVSDTLANSGFEGIYDLKVTVNDTEYSADDDTFQIVDANGNTLSSKDAATNTDGLKKEFGSGANAFTIKFASSFIEDHGKTGQEDVVITYKSKLGSAAGVNYNENTNHASLSYSNDPSSTNTYDNTSSDSYHYTFGIDADVDGQDGYAKVDGTENTTINKTSEINKVKSAGTITGTYELKEIEETTTTGTKKTTYVKKDDKALEGATFELYSDSSCKTKVGASTSDKYGHVSFLGLDEGEYYLKETSAPSGYALSSTVYKVVIDADFDAESGILKQYSIKTYNTSDNSVVGSAIYANDTDAAKAAKAADGTVTNEITVKTDSNSSIIGEIVNTPLGDLPYTGGEGKYAIYLGAATLAGVMGVLIVVKKKTQQA